MATKPFGLAVRTLIDDGRGGLLLLKRAKSSKSFPGTWEFPGGKVDAGAMNISVWHKMFEEKKLDPSQVKVFYTTPPYYDYNWTVRGDLDPALVQKLKDAFLGLDPTQPAHKEILDLQRASKFIPTTPENYQGIEQAARSAGLLK